MRDGYELGKCRLGHGCHVSGFQICSCDGSLANYLVYEFRHSILARTSNNLLRNSPTDFRWGGGNAFIDTPEAQRSHLRRLFINDAIYGEVNRNKKLRAIRVKLTLFIRKYLELIRILIFICIVVGVVLCFFYKGDS